MVVVIADDLTGANATSVLLSRKGFRAVTYLGMNEKEPTYHGFDAVTISTDSRGMTARQAYGEVAAIVSRFRDEKVALYSKRIDTTLRGNIGAEIDAVLDTLNGNELAVVVPSFPGSGRISVGGYLLVNGIPLEKTDVARDPKTPVSTSCVRSLLQGQTRYQVGYVSLKEVLEGERAIGRGILAAKEQGCRVILIDAATEAEIQSIARATAALELPVVAVDPGPFTACLAKELLGNISDESAGKKILFTVGSVTQQTKRQLEELKLKYNPLLICADPAALLEKGQAEEEIRRVTALLLGKMGAYQVLGVTTCSGEIINLKATADRLGITEEQAAQRIASGLAQITSRVLEAGKGAIGGLYTSGGDVTVAVCKKIQAAGIVVKDEVLPLAVYGHILEGVYHGIPIITKGGLIGGDDAMIQSMEYLITKISES